MRVARRVAVCAAVFVMPMAGQLTVAPAPQARVTGEEVLSQPFNQGIASTHEVWLSTDDTQNGLYRVSLRSGRVDALGTAGHVDGEGEGIDATKLRSGQLHVLTVDVSLQPVWFEHVAITRAQPRQAAMHRNARSRDAATKLDSRWPPFLIVAAGVLVAAAVAGVAVVFRQARAATRRKEGAK